MQKALDFRQRRNRNDHRMPVVVTVYCKQARLSTPQGTLKLIQLLEKCGSAALDITGLWGQEKPS